MHGRYFCSSTKEHSGIQEGVLFKTAAVYTLILRMSQWLEYTFLTAGQKTCILPDNSLELKHVPKTKKKVETLLLNL